MTLQGTYYQAGSSQAVDVRVHLGDDGGLRIEGPGLETMEVAVGCRLSEPLGRMARHFSLPGGARLEMADTAALAAWEKRVSRSSGMHLVHLLESRWRWVAAAVLFLLAFMAAGYLWGLPFAARHVALNLPAEVANVATAQARGIIVKMLRFEDSKLPADRREALTREFREMAAVIDPGSGYNYRLEFFDAAMPNAFALPDGLVCVTDGLVGMAANDAEIHGVLAHEIIHVREQHGMRSVLQSSAVFLIWTLMTGDVSTVAGMGSALPAMLAESGYSRGFEQEADDGAADYMIQAGYGTKPLADLLLRMDPEDGSGSLNGAEEAISTHPLTYKRVKRLREREQIGSHR